MTIRKASEVRIYVGAYDLSLMATTAGIGLEAPALDKTVFVDSAESATADIRRDTFSVAGWFDDQAQSVDALISTLIGTGSNIASILIGTGTGARAYFGTVLVGAAKVEGKIGELVRASVNLHPDGRLYPGVHFGPKTTQTGDTVSGSVDLGSALNSGTVYGATHLLQFSGTLGTVTLNIKRGPDTTSWSVLFQHKYTAIGSTLTSTAGVDVFSGVDRYLRVDPTTSTASGTFTWVGIAVVKSTV